MPNVSRLTKYPSLKIVFFPFFPFPLLPLYTDRSIFLPFLIPIFPMQTGYRFLEPQALARVKNLSVVARGVVEGFISGLHSSPYKGFSVEFAEHREYTPGDEPRHLDYRMLARTDRLYVKQYEEETNMRVQILLDTSGSMGYGYDKGITKLQYGCYLTAVLAYLMTRQQDSVGLTTFDKEMRLDMPARGSPRHFNEMMHQLEAVAPGGETDVGETLHKLAGRFKRRCLIVLISDLYDEPDEVIRRTAPFSPRPARSDPLPRAR